MPIATHTVSGNAGNLVGSAIAADDWSRRNPVTVRAWLITNVTDQGEAVVDTGSGGQIYLGPLELELDADLEFAQAGVVATNAPDLNWDGLRYQVLIEFPNRLTRSKDTWRSPWFELTADLDVKAAVEQNFAPAVPVSLLFARMQALVIDDLETTDSQSAALVSARESNTAAALDAYYAHFEDSGPNVGELVVGGVIVIPNSGFPSVATVAALPAASADRAKQAFYVEDPGALYRCNGMSWVQVTPSLVAPAQFSPYSRKTVATTKTNQTLADDPQLKVSLEASTVYDIIVKIPYSGSKEGDLKVALYGPTGAGALAATGWYEARTMITAHTNTNPWDSLNVVWRNLGDPHNIGCITDSATASTGTPQKLAAVLNATVVMGTQAGDVGLSWAQVVTDTVPTTVYENASILAVPRAKLA